MRQKLVRITVDGEPGWTWLPSERAATLSYEEPFELEDGRVAMRAAPEFQPIKRSDAVGNPHTLSFDRQERTHIQMPLYDPRAPAHNHLGIPITRSSKELANYLAKTDSRLA